MDRILIARELLHVAKSITGVGLQKEDGIDGDMRLVERVYSDRDENPSVLLANLRPSSSVRKNLDTMEKVVQIGHQKGANIIIFPELFVTGYVWDDPDDPMNKAVIEQLDEGDNARVAGFMERIRDGLVTDGSGPEYVFYNNAWKRQGRRYDTTFILHPGLDFNTWENSYDKIFLTPIEKRFFTPGSDKRLTVRTRWGSFGFMVCYDLCFVELARKYAFVDNVDAIVTMAHWRSEAVREYPSMNVMTDHYYGYLWDMMNASKAAYNQVWSLGVNAIGHHYESGIDSWGGSGIWAPSGLPVVQASNITPELVLVHNLDIRKERHEEHDDFNYKMDFMQWYRRMKDDESCPLSF